MKIVFFGSGDFGIPLLEMISRYAPNNNVIVVTHPPRKQGRGLKILPSPVEEKAFVLNFKVINQENLKDKEFINLISVFLPDFIIVSDYGKLIPAEIIDLANKNKIKTVNVHPSLLPLYRGATPIQSVLINGEKTTGVTLQILSKKIDAGDILLQEVIEISDDDNFLSLKLKLQNIATRLLETYLLKPDSVIPRPQLDSNATFCYKISNEVFTTDWKEEAIRILNKMRAFYPKGLKCFFRENIIKIIKGEIFSFQDKDEPGMIRVLNKDTLIVSCINGWLKLTELKPENRKIISGKDFINGYKPVSGEKLRSIL